MTVEALKEKSRKYRKDVLTYIYKTGAGHTGGSLSATDVINVLYNNVLDISPENWNTLERDFYVQSKGHSVEALYVVLADQGFIDPTELNTGNAFKSRLIGHPTRKVPGVEQNTGGLGHGLSVSVGLAIAAGIDKRTSKIFCLLGDGELAEGSNWEAAMAASHYRLDNLVAIVDRNNLQITGKTADVVDPEPVADKWSAFGWSVRSADGNDVADLVNLFAAIPFEQGKPSVILATTVKGKGVSFMENRPEWHHKVPDKDMYERALSELADADQPEARA